MRAGKLRHKIFCDEPVASQTDAGEESIIFTEVFWVMGSIEDLPPRYGIEASREGSILAGADVLIKIRWSPRAALITAKWRLRYDTMIFDLKRVIPNDFRRAEIDIIAASGLNKG